MKHDVNHRRTEEQAGARAAHHDEPESERDLEDVSALMLVQPGAMPASQVGTRGPEESEDDAICETNVRYERESEVHGGLVRTCQTGVVKGDSCG